MEKITIEARVAAPREKVWRSYTDPLSVTHWNAASSDWHCPRAENDLRVGGAFTYRMESRDGKEGFDFTGVYDEVVQNEKIAYTMDDGRKVVTTFTEVESGTDVVVTFDPEHENPIEMQKGGWQAILDNFKKYAESEA